MSKMATSAPASASPLAKARPQPRAPPVTSAVRPLSENYHSASAILISSLKFESYPIHDFSLQA
jgi:hypothetical protein